MSKTALQNKLNGPLLDGVLGLDFSPNIMVKPASSLPGEGPSPLPNENRPPGGGLLPALASGLENVSPNRLTPWPGSADVLLLSPNENRLVPVVCVTPAVISSNENN